MSSVNDPRIMQLLLDVGAIVRDSHFVYTSGRHSSVYINKDAVYLHTGITSMLCREMARPYSTEQIDVVVGPIMGGIILSQWIAHYLNEQQETRETLAVYAEKGSESVDKRFFFGRGYDKYIPGKKVLIAEDILTTGGSVRQVVELVRRQGGNVVGITALCNRGNVQPEVVGGVPIHALVAIDLDTYEPQECPFCRDHVPINTELGKGRAFLLKQKARSEE
jgi:orotate phosphoribosyltransferase